MNVDRFLANLTEYRARNYSDAVRRWLVAEIRGNRVEARAARDDLAETVNETVGVAQVIGADLSLRQAAAVLTETDILARENRSAMVRFANEQTLIPRVTFAEALQDMIDRTPMTIRDAAIRTGEAIRRIYEERRAVAFAYASEPAITEKAKAIIVKALREGVTETVAGRRLTESAEKILGRVGDWPESYSRMAFRTNVNTAVTAGRFRQARDPDVAAATPAFRFDAIGDSDVRDNHYAANGVILSIRNRAWNRLAAPLGYNCRCQISLVGVPELRRRGKWRNGAVIESAVPSAAGPDPGFRHGGRPDLFLADL